MLDCSVRDNVFSAIAVSVLLNPADHISGERFNKATTFFQCFARLAFQYRVGIENTVLPNQGQEPVVIQ